MAEDDDDELIVFVLLLLLVALLLALLLPLQVPLDEEDEQAEEEIFAWSVLLPIGLLVLFVDIEQVCSFRSAELVEVEAVSSISCFFFLTSFNRASSLTSCKNLG